MADLDNLNIQIKASSRDAVTAVESLIDALTSLNTSLNNYKSGSQYAQGMETLASGLERVSNAINGIDDGRIKSLSKALDSLNKAGSKISLSNAVNKEVSIAEKRIDAFANKIADAFNIKDKAGKGIIRDDVAKIIGDKDNYLSNIHNMESDVKSLGTVQNLSAVANKEIQSVRQSLKGLKWDIADSAEYGDDLIRTLGKLGYRGKGNVDASTLAQELNDTHGFQFDTSSNVNALNDIIKFLGMAEKEQISFNEAIQRGQMSAEQFGRAYYEATKGLESETFGTKDKMSNEALGVGNISEISKVDTNNLQAVAQGLQAISSVGTIPDFSTIGVLASNINKLSSDKAPILAQTLPQIAQGMRAFNGVNVPNFGGLEGFANGLKSLNSMGTKQATEASSVLPRIAESLRGFSGIVLPDFSQMGKFAEGLIALRSMGADSAVKASYVLPQIAEGLRAFSGITMPNLGNIDGLAKFAKALGSLADSNIQNAIDNLPRLATAFNQLVNSLNQGNIEKQTSSFASSMANLVRALGGTNFQTAMENVPRLAQAFNELVVSINQGGISERTANFARGMGQLATASNSASASMGRLHQQTKNWDNLFTMLGAKVRKFNQGVLKVLGNGLKRVGMLFSQSASHVKTFALGLVGIKKDTETVGNSFERLAQKIGKFWASAFWIINGVRGLWKSVKSSMDYIETLNYFKASFKQVSDTAVGDWEKLGYDSAEAYADSFEKRAKQLTTKMTGFNIEDSGILSMTGGKTLGLNPNTLMNFQAQFAQMASSMGMSANNATLVSQALTEIGADLASVKNMKFEDVWGDMASGLVGMSRTLDKYGVNIRKASLNQKLLDLGLDTTIDKLSGADKALLRVIVLLDSSRFAWSDLAKTINQPANQLRLLTANLQNCARMLGNLFLPLVAKILPYLNAMTIALQRLLTFLAKILGIDISKITSSVGGSNEAISDLLDDADNLDDSLDDASESAKKLKNNLLGVDELNIVGDINSQDANGNMSSVLDDAFLDALSEYQKAWDEAFDNMANKANELAEKIVQWFKDLFKPISKAWEKTGEKVKEAWAKAFKSLGELLKSIFSDAWEVWQNPLNTKIFENLFLILADIGEIVSHLADNFRRAWEEGERGKHILESLQKIFWALTENARELADYMVEWAKNLDFSPLLSSIDGLLQSLADNAYNIFGIWQDWYTKVILPLGKYLIETFFPTVINSLKKMVDAIDFEKLRKDIGTIFESIEGIAELIGGVLLTAIEKITSLIGNNLNPVVERLATSFQNLFKDLKEAKNINDVLNAIFNFGDDRAVDLGEFVNFLTTNINKAFEQIDFKSVGRRVAGVINTFLQTVDVNEFAGAVANIINGILDLLVGFIGRLDWFRVGQAIGDALRQIDWLKVLEGVLKAIWGAIQAWFGSLGSAPIETLLLTAFAGGKIANDVGKALTGEGWVSKMLKSVLGLDKESKALDTVADSAVAGATAKGAFSKANAGVEAGAIAGAEAVKKEGGAFGTLKSGVKGILPFLGKLGAIIGTIGIGEDLGAQIGKFFNPDDAWAYDQFLQTDTLGEAWENIKTYWEGVELIFSQEGENIGKRIVEGIGAGIFAVIATPFELAKALFNWIVGGIKKVFGIHSPAENMKPLGRDILLGVVEGFLGAFSAMGEAIGRFFSEMGTWFAGKWEGLKTSIATAWDGIKTAVEGKLETIRGNIENFVETSVTTLTTWAENAGKAFTEWKETVVRAFGEAWDSFITWKDGVIRHFQEWKETVVGYFTEWKDNAIGAITQWYDDTKRKVEDWIGNAITRFNTWKDDTIRAVGEFKDETIRKIGEWYQNTVGTLKKWYTDATDAIKTWFGETVQKFEGWKTQVEGIVERWKGVVIGKFEEWKQGVFRKIEEWKDTLERRFIEWKDNIVGTFETWKREVHEKIENFKGEAIRKFEEFRDEAKRRIEEFVERTKGKFEDFRDRAGRALDEFKENAVGNFKEFWENGKTKVLGFIDQTKIHFEDWKKKVVGSIEGMKSEAVKIFERFVGEASEWFSEKKWTFDGIRDGLATAITNAWETASTLWESFKEWLNNLPSTFQNLGEAVSRTVSGAYNGAKTALKTAGTAVSTTYEKAKTAVTNLGKTVTDFGKSVATSVSNLGSTLSRQISNAVSSGNHSQSFIDQLLKGRQFATGGFPEDGWFRASHGEIMGKFDNGQSVVANNQQITDGIAKAVYNAMTSAGMGRGREEELLEELIDAVRSGRNITIDGRELVSAYDNRKARNGYAFT